MDLLALIFMCIAAVIFLSDALPLGPIRVVRAIAWGLFFMAAALIFQFVHLTATVVSNH